MTKKTTAPASKLSRQKSKPVAKVSPPMDFPVWMPIIIFALATFIFFWQQLSGGSFFWEDFAEFVYPTQNFAAKAFANGILPFWNPYTFVGMPFIADLQVGFFYPFNRLLSLFISDGQLSVWAAQFIIILHFFIAQLNLYLLARHLRISSIGSILAAISYSFSLILVCHAIHPMIIYHLAWFPVVFMFIHKAIAGGEIKAGNYKSAIYAGLILGMSLLSGHPQTTLYEFFFLGVFVLWFLIAGLRKGELGGGKILRFIAVAAIPFIIAVGIFSIQLLPSQELAGQSQREELSFEKAAEGSMQFKQVFSAVVPKVFGFVDGENLSRSTYYLKFGRQFQSHFYWETSYYFGIVALLIGIFGILLKIRTRMGAFLFAMTMAGFFFSLGSNGFLFPLLFELPLFGSFRNPAKMMFFLVLAFSLFAGFGFDGLWQKLKDKTVLIKLLIITAIALLMAFLVASGTILDSFETPARIVDETASYGSTAVLFIIAVILTAALINRGMFKPLLGGSILIALAFIDLNMAGSSFNSSPNDPAKQYQISKEIENAFIAKVPGENFRVLSRIYNPPYMALSRNQGLFTNIFLVGGYNPLILKRIRPPLESFDDLHNIWNVKYEIRAEQGRQPQFYERTTRYGHAWMVYDAVVTDENRVEDLIKQNKHDLTATVILEEQPDLVLQKPAEVNYSPEIKCTDYSINSFEYEVSTKYNGVLCFSEIWYPAWQVYIDGRPAKLLRADYSFRAVAVPSGSHKIEMKYESRKFNTGMYVTLFTLALSIAGWFIAKKME